MAALLAGRIERSTYCALLRNLFEVYVALEAAPPPAGGPGPLAAFDLVALRRSGALAADLAHLHGPGWREGLAVQPSAQGYAARVRQLAARGGCELVAHAYVRYLGDLHGGQLLKRRVAQALGLHDDAGVRFYEFGPADRVEALRLDLRQVLATVPLDDAGITTVVDEARWAFAQHIALFDELMAEAADA